MATDEYGTVVKCDHCLGRLTKRGGRVRIEHNAPCPIGERVRRIHDVRANM